MGLFKELVLLPLAPARGTAWVAEQLADEVDRRLYDEDNIRREMIQLEIDEMEGRISAEERTRGEEDLLERLAVARQRAAEEQELMRAEMEGARPMPAPAASEDQSEAIVEGGGNG